MKSLRIDTSREHAALTFAALGSEARLEVLQALVRAGPEGLGIGALGSRSGITGSTLTFHVNTLARARLITRKKRGRQVICAADTAAIRALSDYLLAECCADRPGGARATAHGDTDG